MKTFKMGQPPSKPKDLKEKFNLSQKQYDDLKHTFEEHSKGKKGISKTQFRKVYSSRFPGNVSGYADKMFDCFDTDGNGHVDFGEFVTGICLMDSNNIEDRIGIAFTLFDQDKSGFIDRHEVRELLSVSIRLLSRFCRPYTIVLYLIACLFRESIIETAIKKN